MSVEHKTIDSLSLPVESTKLHCASLNEVAKALSESLTSGFEHVEVKVCDCPNLKEAPFHLASEGLNGKTSLIDVGGPPYLLPNVNREKLYTFKGLNDICGGVNPAFFVGAGAGPFPFAGTNCEMVANVKVTNECVSNHTRIVRVINYDKGEIKVEILPNSETRFALLGNFFLSEGKSGQVVKIHCKKRKTEDNFITAIRQALKNKFGSKPVGMGGVFILNNGKAKQHVMPDFSKKPVTSEDELNKWLYFTEMNAPLIAVGTLISDDPGLDLRVQHFHSFNLTGQGGHYHYDTTPDIVEYTAYLNVADYLYRVDKPLHTHQFGRD